MSPRAQGPEPPLSPITLLTVINVRAKVSVSLQTAPETVKSPKQRPWILDCGADAGLLRIALTIARESPGRVFDLIYDKAVKDTTVLRANLFIFSVFQI